jgi:hypothetical protein
MITEYSQIQRLFVELDAHITKKAIIYMIGGGALMKRKMKSMTKDIDIVVDSETEFNNVQAALRKARFETILPTKGYERLELSQIFVRDDFRIDLFCRKVCGRFSLSENMKGRSDRDVIQTRSIELRVCSPEDIFLFKTMTERDGDLDDCSNIIKGKTDFKWSVVLDEAQVQSREGQAVWITWITNRLEEFAERMDIPILDDMIGLADEYIAEWERDLLSRNAIDRDQA